MARAAPNQSMRAGLFASPPARISGHSAQKISAAIGMLIQKIQVQPNEDAVINPPHNGPSTLPISCNALTAPSTGLRSPAG